MLVLSLFTVLAYAQTICPTPSAGSCTIKNDRSSSCLDMIAPQLPPNFSSECVQRGGRFSSSPCPATALVGSCDLTQNGSGVVMRFYAPVKPEVFPQVCTQMRARYCQ